MRRGLPRPVAAGMILAAILVPVGMRGAPGADGREALTLLKEKCVRCHGPARTEADLNLATPEGIARGGRSGPAAVPGSPARSRIWSRVLAGEMPPGAPLDRSGRRILHAWLAGGARGLPPAGADSGHWAWRPLRQRGASRGPTSIDDYLQRRLERDGLSLRAEAPRETLLRRLSFDLTGLPPTPEALRRFLADRTPGAYERMVDRYLGSPHYGERWGKHWLDAAGYADSNGYFSADTERPHAHRYRDYVIRRHNQGVPWDRFIQEQLAGDQLAGYSGGEVRPEWVELLEATHYLRNSPDGTDSSDGNPEERRADKYAVLEGTLQMLGSSLLGMTVQCARCHSHKFEPFTQRDYYALQAVLHRAFPIEKWVYPAKRVVDAATAAERAAWERQTAEIDGKIAALRAGFAAWLRANPEPTVLAFEATFDTPAGLAAEWSNTVPGDSAGAGTPPVAVGSAAAPGAVARDGRLDLLESGAAGDRALSTRRIFDWTPEALGNWVQASFRLVPTPNPAPYVGYFIALRDFNDVGSSPGGNILLDGAAAGKAAVHADYPGHDSMHRGAIGRSGYTPGRRYGVRVTNLGGDRFELRQVVDDVPEDGVVVLNRTDLPDGAFGFEYCCGRSFGVDDVRIEASDPRRAAAAIELAAQRKSRQEALEQEVGRLEKGRPTPPGQLAIVSDVTPEPAAVPLLLRGEYGRPGETVPAAPPAFLDASSSWADAGQTRLAFARWLTQPDSRQAALLARVTVNRWWAHHFGRGLVATVDNLGLSGSAPDHPELLEYLAGRLIDSGWDARAVHREIVLSRAFRQSSRATGAAARRDPENRLLSHFPLRRLDAEAIRDGMLAVSGELDLLAGGPPVPVTRSADGDLVVDEASTGARRRSVYLQQRRTQVHGLLQVFDAPSIVVNCAVRPSTTVPLQSLSLLNSPFVRARAAGLAAVVLREAGDDTGRLEAAFRRVAGRSPDRQEWESCRRFLSECERESAGEVGLAGWTDLCQMLLASNAFLYVE